MSSNNESVKTNILKEFLDWCSDSDKQTNAFIEKNFERIYGISPSLVNNNSLTHCLGVENTKSFEAFSESFLRENPIDQIKVSKTFKKFDKDSAIEAIENSIGTKKELLFNKNGKLKIDSVITNESDIIPALIALASEIKINPPAEYKTAKEYFQETNQSDKLEELNQYINSYEKFITSIILSLDKSTKKSFEKVYLKNEKSYEEFINKVGEFALQMSECKTENEITDFNKRFKNLVSAHATNQQWNTDSNKEPNDMIKTSRAHLFGCDISIFDLEKNNENVEDPRSLTEKFSATSFMEALKNINNHDINNYLNGNLYTIIKTIEAYQIKNVGKTPHDKLSEADVITILYATFKLFSNEEFQLEDKVKLYGKNGVEEKRNSALEVLLSFGDIINDIRFRRNINSDICYQQGLALAEQVLETEKQKQKEAENEALRQAQGSASEPTPTHIDITPEDQQEQATETPAEQQAAADVVEEEDLSDTINATEEEQKAVEEILKENKKQLTPEEKKDKLITTRRNFLDKLLGKFGDISSEAQSIIDNLKDINNDPALSDNDKKANKKAIKKATSTQTAINRLKGRIDPYKFYCIRKSVEISNSTENTEELKNKIKREIRLGENPQNLTDSENSDNNRTPMPKTISLLVEILQNITANRTNEQMQKALINSAKQEIKVYDEYLKHIKKNKLENSAKEYYSFVQKKQEEEKAKKQADAKKKAKKDLGKPAGKANAQQEQANEKPVEQKVETSQTENVMEEKIEKPANETVSEKKVDEQVAEKEVATTIVEENPTQTETSDSSNDDSIEQ